jgi:hypothetical protein
MIDHEHVHRSVSRFQFETLQDLRDEALLDEIYSRVYANPERAGTPFVGICLTD